MATKEFNPKLVKVNFRGIMLSGYADGSFVKVTANADAFSLVVGADGESVRVASADESAEVEITLNSQTSVNDALMAAHIADRLDGSGHGPFSIEDLATGRLLHGDDAWIKRMPDQEFAKDHTPRTWVLTVPRLVPAFPVVA